MSAGAIIEKKPRYSRKHRDVDVASQWRLMYWKFIKHKLALVALPIIILLLIIAAFGEFIAPHTSLQRFTSYKEAPSNGLNWVDGEGKFHWMPFVFGMERHTDPETFRRTFSQVKSETNELGFFVRGEPYKLWSLFPSDIHLFGAKDPGAPFFLFGTDTLGRCVFSRVIYGTRVSLGFGVLSVFFTFIIGVTLGGISGYFGGFPDLVIQRAIDMIRSIPNLPLWMALAAALPRDWDPILMYFGMIFVMSLIGWTDLARAVRGKLLSIREEDFTMAARLNGASNFRIIFKHMLPSFASYMIVEVTMSIPFSILGETSLSFLGLGLQPPVVSWGVMLQDAQSVQALAQNPWLLWPVAFVIATVLAFNFLGDGLRDAADPYTR